MSVAMKWSVTKGPFTAEEIKAQEAGGCAALVAVTVAREGPNPFAGPKDFSVVTVDGHSWQGMHPMEIFQTWTVLAAHLEGLPIPVQFKRIAHSALEKSRSMIAKSRKPA